MQLRSRASLVMWVAGAVLAVSSLASAHGRYPEGGRIAFHPTDDDVIVVRTTFGFLATRDGGATWRWICTTVFGARRTEDPAIEITADGSFVAGVFDGVSVGTEAGCEWGFPEPMLSSVVVIDVARDPAAASTVYALTSTGRIENGLWRSVDDGRTWAPTNAAIDPILFETIKIAPTDPTRIYLSGAYPPSATDPRRPFIYRSDDTGATFAERAFTDFAGPPDRNVYVLGVDPANADRLIVLVKSEEDDRIYLSENGSETFEEVLALPRIDAFAWSDDGTAWVGGKEDVGIVASHDGGRTWEPAHEGISVGCLGARREELWVCTDNYQDGFGIGMSTDGAATITPVLEYRSIPGIVECSADSTTITVCGPELPDIAFDLGLPIDAGPLRYDAGAFPWWLDGGPAVDAGPGMDAGGGPGDDGGCGCRVASPAPADPARPARFAIVAIAALGIVGRARRRRPLR